MKISAAIIIIITFLSFSCNSKLNHQPVNDLRDSILKKYIRTVDTSENYDTTNTDYLILKAYHNNDTNTLKKCMHNFLSANEEYQYFKKYYSCLNLVSIKD